MATTATGNYVCDNSSLANFQSWTGAIFSAIESFGWLQTADTGQCANPPASVPSSAYIYRIYKANDTAAGTQPIYLKIDVGYSATSVRLRMTTGTGSNGSGTISGSVSSAPWNLDGGGLTNQGATVFPCFFSGDAGNFRMIMWGSATIAILSIFLIMRSVDASGNYTADHFTILSNGNFNFDLGQQQTIFSSVLQTTRETGIISTSVTSGSNTQYFNGQVAAFPIVVPIGKVDNPPKDILTVAQPDVGHLVTVTVANLYGGTHTFISVNPTTNTIPFQNSFGYLSRHIGSIVPLMRYE